jgi:hypothetical protein
MKRISRCGRSIRNKNRTRAETMITSTMETPAGTASAIPVVRRTRQDVRAGGGGEIMAVEEGLASTAITIPATSERRMVNVRIGVDIATDPKSEIRTAKNLSAEVDPRHPGDTMTITTTDHAEDGIPHPPLLHPN